MKKAYIIPNSTIYNVELSNILATSVDSNSKSFTINTSEEVGADESLSRENNSGSSVWSSGW